MAYAEFRRRNWWAVQHISWSVLGKGFVHA